MSCQFKLLCFIATGFFLCNREVATGSLGMPTERAENGTEVVIEDDGEEGDGDEGKDDTDDSSDEDEEHEDDGDGGDGRDDGDKDEGHGDEDERVEDCTPPTNSSAPVGLRGYRRYFANDSLIGRPVPCTRDDKICFRHNLVFHPIEDICTHIGDSCNREMVRVVVNRTELEQGSGRVIGSCPKYDDPCPGYRMAYDGLCYRKEIVRDVICGCNATLSPHIMGGMECREEPLSPINVQQPKEDGSCLIPDLRNPDVARSNFRPYPTKSDNPIEGKLTCDRKQGECFTQEKLWVPGYKGCHTLLKQGPCAEDHVVALNHQAATEGRAEGACVDVRGGCPKGYKRMLFDGQCHEDREIEIEAPGGIALDWFGRYFILAYGFITEYRLEFDGDQFCEIEPNVFGLFASSPPLLPPCGQVDMGGCHLYEVKNDLPKPEF